MLSYQFCVIIGSGRLVLIIISLFFSPFLLETDLVLEKEKQMAVRLVPVDTSINLRRLAGGGKAKPA